MGTCGLGFLAVGVLARSRLARDMSPSIRGIRRGFARDPVRECPARHSVSGQHEAGLEAAMLDYPCSNRPGVLTIERLLSGPIARRESGAGGTCSPASPRHLHVGLDREKTEEGVVVEQQDACSTIG